MSSTRRQHSIITLHHVVCSHMDSRIDFGKDELLSPTLTYLLPSQLTSEV